MSTGKLDVRGEAQLPDESDENPIDEGDPAKDADDGPHDSPETGSVTSSFLASGLNQQFLVGVPSMGTYVPFYPIEESEIEHNPTASSASCFLRSQAVRPSKEAGGLLCSARTCYPCPIPWCSGRVPRGSAPTRWPFARRAALAAPAVRIKTLLDPKCGRGYSWTPHNRQA